MDCFSDFQSRGLVYATTDDQSVAELINEGGCTVYCGFDPTSDSLHVGSLVPIFGLARLQRAGNRPIALVGGATGLIGDPSGKSEERNLLDRERLEANIAGIRTQLGRFLDFDDPKTGAILLDNSSWLGEFSLLDFLRDIGKHFTVNHMVAKESVKSRMSDETGISFTEFTYMLLQATDFLHLYKEHECTLQVGGSDQWGNITAGMELVRRVARGTAYGMTFPLIMNADGSKLGKTEKGAVWLDPERTSPFLFYQYFVRTDDRDVVRFLNYFTFLERAEIDELAQMVEEEPHRRVAQKRLAGEVTTFVHGADACRSAQAATNLLYGGSVDDLTEADLLAAAEDLPRSEMDEPLGPEGRTVIDLLEGSSLVKSRGDAKRSLAQGGVYINNQRWSVDAGPVGTGQLLFGRYLLMRLGKKNYELVVFKA